MAIAFIPVRDQAKVFRANRESSLGKGTVLKRLSTGKKISDPRDNSSDYQKVSNMKMKIAEYNEAIKQASLGTSLFEVALSTYQLLEEYYAEIESIAAEIDTINPPPTGDSLTYYQNYVKGKQDAITNLLAIKFDGKTVAKAESTPSTLSISVAFSGTYSAVTVSLTELTALTAISDSSTVDNIKSLKDPAKNNKATAAANYKLLMAGITNIANIEKLTEVQKTNTTAAISALEDIDVQEEMMNLMQAQILEELSSEALIKIKESSKYIINLIRA